MGEFDNLRVLGCSTGVHIGRSIWRCSTCHWPGELSEVLTRVRLS